MRERRALIRKIHYIFLEPLYVKLLADVEAGTGNVKSALDLVDEALSDTEQTGQSWFNAELHRTRGELLLQRHPADTAAAEAALKRAIDVARRQQTRTFELRAALLLAKLCHATERDQAAHELLVPALIGFSEGPELPEVEQANRLLATLSAQVASSAAQLRTGKL